MIPGINESKALIKHISCDFDGRKHCSKQKYVNNRYQCECKIPTRHLTCKQDYASHLSMSGC